MMKFSAGEQTVSVQNDSGTAALILFCEPRTIVQDTDALEKRLVLAGFVGCKTAISPTGDAMVPSASLVW